MNRIHHLQCFWRSNTIEYEVGRIPDLVVIYLGNNDDSHIVADPEKGVPYDAAYRSLVDMVRKNYGEDTPLLLLVGTTLSDVSKEVTRKIAADYSGVKVVPFIWHKSGYGNYPTAEEHRIEKDDFIPILRELYPDLFPVK